MTERDRIRAVLEAHPLEAGKDFYAGIVICRGCESGLGNPTQHLLQALLAELDPEHQTPPVKLEAKQTWLKESSIGFEDGAA